MVLRPAHTVAYPENAPRNFRYGGCELGNRSLALSSLSTGPRASRAMDGSVLLSSYACGGARTPESRRTLRGPNACRNIRLKSSRDAQPLLGIARIRPCCAVGNGPVHQGPPDSVC